VLHKRAAPSIRGAPGSNALYDHCVRWDALRASQQRMADSNEKRSWRNVIIMTGSDSEKWTYRGVARQLSGSQTMGEKKTVAAISYAKNIKAAAIA